MNNRRILFPPILFPALLLFFLSLISFQCYIIVSTICDSPFYNGLTPTPRQILFLCGELLIYLSETALLSAFAIYVWSMGCRLVIISNENIQRGIIRPHRIFWKDVSFIGVTPFDVPDSMNKTSFISRNKVIVVVSGKYSEDDLYQRGVHVVWFWRCVAKFAPRLSPLFAKFEKNWNSRQKKQGYKPGPELITPDEIIWVKYNAELYDEFLHCRSSR